jgi:hypothetical protein
MDISGRIIKLLPLQTGEGKNGTWKKQEFIIEVPGQFPKKVCFSVWGDKIAQFPLKLDEEVTVSFDLESREYNNRWYTEAKAWKVASKETAPGAMQNDQDPFNAGPLDSIGPEEFPRGNVQNDHKEKFDDLPF